MSTRGITLCGLLGLLLVGCGGNGPGAGPPSPLSCDAQPRYVGAALHPAWPTSSLPPATGPSPPSPPMPAALASQLDTRLQALLLQTGAPAVSAAIDVPGLGRWSATQGAARLQPLALVDEHTLFPWASVSKSITAALLLQRVAEGRLQLADRLARWFAQVPQADLVTLQQLLTHTSGLASNALTADGQVPETPAALLLAAYTTPSVACPGSLASYSNTGYLLLGLILEQVAGQPFDALLQQHIARPLGLQHLRALGPGERVTTNVATPHHQGQVLDDPAAWSRVGSGHVVARADDMLRYWQAWLGGQLLPAAMVSAQWSLLYPLQSPADAGNSAAPMWFGQGVMLMPWQDTAGRQRHWLGHLGGTAGNNAVLAYDPLAGAWLAVAVNSEVSSTAIANQLLTLVMDWQAAH